MKRVKIKERKTGDKRVQSIKTNNTCGELCDPIYEIVCHSGDNPDATGGYEMICENTQVGEDCYPDPICFEENPEDPEENPCNGPNWDQYPECYLDECEFYGNCDEDTVTVTERIEFEAPSISLEIEDQQSFFMASTGGLGFSILPYRILPAVAFVTRELPSRLITNIVQDPLVGTPIYANYTDTNGNPAVRYVTLISQYQNAVITGSSATLTWSCIKNSRYTYINGQGITRQNSVYVSNIVN